MKKIIFSAIALSIIFSCGRVQKEAKNAINKSGEFIGESSSEFVDGISSGVDKKFKCEFHFKDESKFSGIEIGKYEILNGKSGHDNVLSLYMIFNKAFADTMNVKLYDKENLEYGRTMVFVSGKKDEANYVDIEFEDRISIESISSFVFE